MTDRRLLLTLRRKCPSPKSKFLRSTKAIAIPVTYMMLFASTVAIISITYSLAIGRIAGRGALVETAIATQNMQALDDSLRSIAWSFGGSKVVYMDDCGGLFTGANAAQKLVISLTDGHGLNSIIFNNSVGEVSYDLQSSESGNYGTYVRGDGQLISNKSQYGMTQLYFTTSGETQNLVLRYRPFVNVAVVNGPENKPTNLIRVSILILSSFPNMRLSEQFRLRLTSVNVTMTLHQYEFNTTVTSLVLNASFDEASGGVTLPIVSGSDGAVVNLEIAVCNLKLQKVEV